MKASPSQERRTVPLEMTALPDDGPHPGAPAFCQNCDAPLDIHQPDADRPHLLLGTCGDCGLWHAVALGSRSNDGLVVLLPLEALARKPAPARPRRPSAV